MAAAVHSARAHIPFRFPDGVHASVEYCHDCGALLVLLDATKVTLRQLRETMGLLRIPVAKPFYKRLQAFMCVLEKVSVPLQLQSNQIEDL
jgi:hypothetical protein